MTGRSTRLGPEPPARAPLFVTSEAFLDDEDCALLRQIGAEMDTEPPDHGNTCCRGDAQVRQTWGLARAGPTADFVYGLFRLILETVNAKHFGYALDAHARGERLFDTLDAGEFCSFLAYSAGSRGYRQHHDAAKSMRRRLSLVAFLSDPDDYEGGQLEMRRDHAWEVVPNGLGTVVVFDSRTVHRVTPITGGVRHTAVAWANAAPD
jgi:predicted 2-oxoglutarate/Fe(II)-dependent dioxygenase YbiX